MSKSVATLNNPCAGCGACVAVCPTDAINMSLNGYGFFSASVDGTKCIDCGKWFEINIKDNQTCRCPDCYTEYRRNYYKEKKREQRAKAKMSTNQ